jgi:AmmeMemoRadiSam system protein B
MAVRFGQSITSDEIDRLLVALDEALLLENERSNRARQEAHKAFLQASFREPVLAGRSYPAEKDELETQLQAFLEEAGIRPSTSHIRGLVSPHIDFERGGPVYARVWGHAAEAVRAADLVVIIGTDHFGDSFPVTLTRQNYATPFGTLPTERSVVDRLAQSLGETDPFEGELFHRAEHSVELAAIWLHFIRGGQPVDLVPILSGSFEFYRLANLDPNQDPTLRALIDALKDATSGRRVLVVAAGDLSHVGPAFGDQPPNLLERGQMQRADEELIEHMTRGDAEGFFNANRRVGDKYNVCGISPIYLALKMLGETTGDCIAYDRCRADAQGSSFVTICGATFI